MADEQDEGELHEENLDASEEAMGESAKAASERVKANLASRVGGWSGVSSCCDSSRAINELRPHFEAWVSETIAANPDRLPLAKGWESGQLECRSGGGGGSARWCRAKFTSIVCYVDFA